MTVLVVYLAFVIYWAMAAPSNDVDDSAAFLTSNHLFTSNLYKQIVKNEKGNLIMSPLSAEVILALTNEGAKGITSEELQTGLNLPSNKQATQNALKEFLPKLRTSEENLQLFTANKIYAGNDVKLKESFNEVAVNIYGAGVENIDFSANSAAARTISQWVEQNTNNKIRDLIKPRDVNSRTKLVLVNTLYFKGQWESTFKKFETHKQKFYRSKDDTKEVDMMKQTRSFKYYENEKLNAKFIELPYKGANISMVIALPNEIDGLSKSEGNIGEFLEPQPFTTERVEVQIPKFQIETELQLKPILQELGIRKIFTREADLSGLTCTHEDGLYVDKVIQKSFIKVDEDGTEAASATGLTIMLTSLPRPPNKIFKADHPFFFFIKYNEIVLFGGKFQE